MADRFQCLGPGPGAPLPAAPAAADDEDLARGGAAAVGTVGAVSGGGWDLGWSGKGSFLYHAELVADVLVHGFTLAHYMHVWILHGVSFHVSGVSGVDGTEQPCVYRGMNVMSQSWTQCEQQLTVGGQG